MPYTASAQGRADEARVLKAALKSQYHAALAMLREAIEQCPDDLWIADGHAQPYWRIAYHALYYSHLYVQPSPLAFSPWECHQTNIQYLDDLPAPPEIEDLVELSERPPVTGEPYGKSELIDYWRICDEIIDSVIDSLDILSAESGFSWKKMTRAEHQIQSIRHVQHHAAQLADRLRAAADVGVGWVSVPREGESQF